MSRLSADEILAIQDLQRRDVVVPEWNDCTITIVELSEEDAEAFNLSEKTDVDWIVVCCRDADGNRLFTPEHIPALRKKSWRAFMRLVKVCLEVNGFTKSEQEKIEKKLEPEPAGDSISA